MTAATKSHARVLRESRALIEDKKRWTIDTQARDRHGHRVDPLSEKAVRWCATGAYVRVTNSPARVGVGSFAYLTQASINLFEDPYITYINDCKGHTAVLAMYDEAIRLAEAEEGGQP